MPPIQAHAFNVLGDVCMYDNDEEECVEKPKQYMSDDEFQRAERALNIG